MRALLSTMGASTSTASSLASYLMFEAGYTRELIELGFSDAMARRDEVIDLISAASRAPAAVTEVLTEDGERVPA